MSDQIDQANVELRNLTDTFDRAIAALSSQSESWQVVLRELEESLVDDVRSTVRVEVTNLLRTSVLGAGAEFRCDAEFLRQRTERELRRIRNDLATALNRAGANPPLPLLPVAPTRPFVCSAVPSAIDLSLAGDRRPTVEFFGFDLLSAPITAQIVDRRGSRRSVSGDVNIISDFHLVVDLTVPPATPELGDRRLVLRWSRQDQSRIAILHPGDTAEGGCTIRRESVSARSDTMRLDHVRNGGDRNFKGHGPCIEYTASLGIEDDGKTLVAHLFMRAFECKEKDGTPRKDYTTGEKEKRIPLFQATGTKRILSFDVRPSYAKSFVDTDPVDNIEHEADVTSMIETLVFTGSTPGDDVGAETGVVTRFRTIGIELEECPEPPS